MNVNYFGPLYAYPIPASEPVADALAAVHLQDAPAIEANAPCVLQDLANAMREVIHRTLVKLSHVGNITSDELVRSVTRCTLVSGEVTERQLGVLPLGASPWAQLLAQGRRTEAALAVLTNEVAELRVEVRRTAAQGRRTEAAVTVLTNDVRGIGIKVANMDARRQNALAISPGTELVPLSNAQGLFPRNFPRQLRIFLALSDARIRSLSLFYGVPLVPRESANIRRQSLHQFVGIVTPV